MTDGIINKFGITLECSWFDTFNVVVRQDECVKGSPIEIKCSSLDCCNLVVFEIATDELRKQFNLVGNASNLIGREIGESNGTDVGSVEKRVEDLASVSIV